MRLELDPADLTPIVRTALAEVLAERDRLGDTERLGYPEPEAARLLGLASHQLRDARRRGEIDGRRIGRSVVYSRQALLTWLDGDDRRAGGRR
ncbi:MAG TPA: helix-turn-helix domain-containing protein [Pirellulales bacterium]|jgi:hypothetical protein|nr:helix-turn-helix domain-containing protein [Pirellulales bacterium]